jgi:hypothetical protein
MMTNIERREQREQIQMQFVQALAPLHEAQTVIYVARPIDNCKIALDIPDCNRVSTAELKTIPLASISICFARPNILKCA